MDTTREELMDGVVVLSMVLYGLFVAEDSPIMAITAWLIGAVLVLRHTIEPFEAFAEENQGIFLVLLLAISTVGFLLSY